jgi:hypothetical protein
VPEPWLTAAVTTTETPPMGVGCLRNTPSWRGYLVGWLVCASVFVFGLLLFMLGGEGFVDVLTDINEVSELLGMATVYLLFTLVVSGLGLIPVALLLHFVLRRVEAQWVHVVAFGLAITAVYGVAFALEDPAIGAVGLGPGAAAAIGRLSVAGRRWRRVRDDFVGPTPR